MTENDYSTKRKAIQTGYAATLDEIEAEYETRRNLVDEGADLECDRLLNAPPELSAADYSAQLTMVFARRNAELAPVFSDYATDVKRATRAYFASVRALNNL